MTHFSHLYEYEVMNKNKPSKGVYEWIFSYNISGTSKKDLAFQLLLTKHPKAGQDCSWLNPYCLPFCLCIFCLLYSFFFQSIKWTHWNSAEPLIYWMYLLQEYRQNLGLMIIEAGTTVFPNGLTFHSALILNISHISIRSTCGLSHLNYVEGLSVLVWLFLKTEIKIWKLKNK